MTQSIREGICPKCGKPSTEHGLCRECRIGQTPWFTCDRIVTNTRCPSCDAIKQSGAWADSTKTQDELAPELARSAVHFHADIRKPSIDVTVTDLTINRSRADLRIHGMLYKQPVDGHCSLEIRWLKEQCDRCNRISGSYYEGVVQIRAEGRIPSTYELQMTESIAQQVEDTVQAGGERLSFISDVGLTKDGLDITVGSQHIGSLIAKAITAQLGGRYSTHPKLVGEKNGRQLFRITYSVRLPRYRKYDVVKGGKKFILVDRVEAHHVRGRNLSDGSDTTAREEDIEKLIGNARNAESGLVVFTDGKTMGIMDPQSLKTVEMREPKWLHVEAGQTLQLLRDGGHLIIVG